MISFYLKNAQNINLQKCFKHFLASNYDKEDVEEIEKHVFRANELRNTMIKGINNKTPTPELLEDHKKYYAQIQLLSKVIPFSKNGVNCEFVWEDSFRVVKKSSSTSIEHEKNCVLFNIAVLHHKLALKHNRKTNAGIADSIKNFIKSAAIFAKLIEKTRIVPADEKTMDMGPACLQVAALFSQAQAQTCFFEKAREENYTIDLVSNLAFTVAEIYNKAREKIETDKDLRKWIKKSEYNFFEHIKAQSEIFFSTAYFWAAKSALSQKKYGEEVAWLLLSSEHMKKAEATIKKYSLHSVLKKPALTLSEILEKERDRSISDNHTIYHHKVPDKNDLKKLSGKVMAIVKTIDLAEFEYAEMESALSKIVPMAVAKEGRRIRQEVQTEINKIAERVEGENRAHLELLERFSHFTQTECSDVNRLRENQFGKLLDEVEEIKKCGGWHFMNTERESLKNSYKKAVKTQEEIMKELKEEEKLDSERRRRYSVYWNIVPSERITTQILKEVETVKNFLSKAEVSNQRMKKRLDYLKDPMEYFESSSRETISKTLPVLMERFRDHEIVIKIREDLKLISDLVEQKSNVVQNAINCAKSEKISVEICKTITSKKYKSDQLPKLYEKMIFERTSPVDEDLLQMEQRVSELHATLQSLGKDFESLGESDSALREKKEFLSKYQKVLKSYRELRQSFMEGAKFYLDLENFYLAPLSKKVKEFVFARRNEGDLKEREIEQMMRANETMYFGEGGLNNLEGSFSSMNLRSGNSQNKNGYPPYGNYFYPDGKNGRM